MNEANVPKKLLFHDEARSVLLDGVNQLADAVSVTMGPGGLNVVIERPGQVPILTKDGVTVAKAVNLPDRMQNLGVSLVKEAASGAADVAGDGTTAATVLARSIFELGLKGIHAGHNSVKMRKGINIASELVIEEIKKNSNPVRTDEEVIQIGTISANGEKEIGEYLSKAMNAVGRDGVITVEEAKGYRTSLEKVEGTRIDRGFISPYFINNKNKNICQFQDAHVLLTNKKITSLREILPLLEQIHAAETSLLIIAADVEGEALNGLVVNATKGTLKVCVIRAPEFGQNRLGALEDLSILLDTDVYMDGDDLAKLKLGDMGKVKKAVISKSETILINPSGSSEEILKRTEDLRESSSRPGLDPQEVMALQRRLSRLSGGIAIIKVGGSTEAELRERKDRVEDALHATRAAVSSGILPGGGIALLKCSKSIKHDIVDPEIVLGIEILKKACKIPIYQITKNAGQVPEIIIEKVLSNSSFSYGYDARNNEYGDMKKKGVIDPTLVIISALRHAVSAADNLLSVSCAMHSIEED
jgi:chaperonin GroEL